jgi:hypothetical protein
VSAISSAANDIEFFSAEGLNDVVAVEKENEGLAGRDVDNNLGRDDEGLEGVEDVVPMREAISEAAANATVPAAESEDADTAKDEVGFEGSPMTLSVVSYARVYILYCG